MTIPVLVGTLPDHRVVVEFQCRPVDHLKLTPEQAEQMAEGLLEAARDAKKGRILVVPAARALTLGEIG